MNRHVHIGPGGARCPCCLAHLAPKLEGWSSAAAKRRETRAALAAVDDESDWYCAFGCGRLIEEHDIGGVCRSCRMYAEDYEAMMLAEYEREMLHEHF